MVVANRAALFAVVMSEFFLRQSLWEFRREHRTILHGIFFIALLFVGFQKKFKFPGLSGDPWSGIYSVLCVKAVFVILPFAFEILLTILRISWGLWNLLASFVLRIFDATPLWLLAAVGPPIFSKLAKVTGVYLRWWLWGAFWAVGSFAVAAVAVLSALLGFKIS